jgi:hypothetical protein
MCRDFTANRPNVQNGRPFEQLQLYAVNGNSGTNYEHEIRIHAARIISR